jgi:hypothetical protein
MGTRNMAFISTLCEEGRTDYALLCMAKMVMQLLIHFPKPSNLFDNGKWTMSLTPHDLQVLTKNEVHIAYCNHKMFG